MSPGTPMRRCGAISITVPLALLLSASTVKSATSSAVSIDNEIIGTPEIECGADRVEMLLRTREPFFGKIFVKGHYNEPNCRSNFTDDSANDIVSSNRQPVIGITLLHGQCGMGRQRMLNPQGMQFSTVIIISFHPLFITSVDRAFHVRCMYREQAQTVKANVDVSDVPTTQLSQTHQMPLCTYTIRKDEIDGPILRYARVGEQVVHRWECQSDTYGMLVHTCYVEDGQGQRMQIVDERGCHMDRFIMGDPTYTESLNLAYREAHVFKFADRVAVRFQCQIKLCMREEAGCTGITPPICDSAGRGRAVITNMTTTTAPTTSTTTTAKVVEVQPSGFTARRRYNRAAPTLTDFEPVSGDFQSQFIYVLDGAETAEDNSNPQLPDDKNQAESDKFESLTSWLARNSRIRGAIVRQFTDNEQGICINAVSFAILLTCIGTVLLSASIAVGIAICRRLVLSRNKCTNVSSVPTLVSQTPTIVDFTRSMSAQVWHTKS